MRDSTAFKGIVRGLALDALALIEKAATRARRRSVEFNTFVDDRANLNGMNINATRKALVSLSQALCLGVLKVLSTVFHRRLMLRRSSLLRGVGGLSAALSPSAIAFHCAAAKKGSAPD
jgi:hypothetical protein